MQINNSYSLREISEITGGRCYGNIDVKIKNIHFDSRRFVKDNDHLFIAFKTFNDDGHSYINKVYEFGVKQFLTHKKPKNIQKDTGYLVVKDTLIALQTWAAYHRLQYKIPVLAITGSYGKTIIKEWIYFLIHRKIKTLRSPKSYNSQFGAALTLLSLQKEHELAIIETGISYPGEMNKMKKMIQPTHTILSNVGDEHIENFNSYNELKKEKEIILKNTQFTYFKNYNDIAYRKSIKNNGSEIISLINKKYCFLIHQKDEISYRNFICCLNFLDQIEFSSKEIKKWCSNLPEIALRFEKKIGINNSIIINDSYANNIQSLKIALENLKLESNEKNTVLILSDPLEKNYDYKELSKIIRAYKISQFIGIGTKLYNNKSLFLSTHLFYKDTAEFWEDFQNIDFQNNFILIKGDRSPEFQKTALKLEAKKHETILEINLSNLIKNFNRYKKLLSPATKVLVMIKASGYGTGLIESAKVLEQNKADYLGVAYADEGIELRKNNITLPILIMNVSSDSMEDIIDHQLTPSIHDLHQLNHFTNILVSLGIKNYPIHIKLNTGMNRLGFDKNEINDLCDYLLAQPEIKVEGIFSHLAASEIVEGKDLTKKQINSFQELSTLMESKLSINTTKHILNTSGIENYSDHEMDMVRLGIGLYVGSKKPYNSTVASLITRIAKIRNIKRGDHLGYGLDRVEKNMKIAIIPIGYADGFKRKFGNGVGQVYIKDSFCKTVGNICMDMSFIDITNTDFNVGDRVEIFGKNNDINKVAKSINTIAYELISSISNRVVRVYLKD